MTMHFEPEKGQSINSQIELRTESRLAARIRATRSGIVIDLAEGFEFPGGSIGYLSEPDRLLHVEIREREA